MIPFGRVGVSHWTATEVTVTGRARTFVGEEPGTVSNTDYNKGNKVDVDIEKSLNICR